MTASYPITEARGQLGELARRAAQHERVVLTDRGRPAAVLISPAELEDMEDALAVARLERDRALGVQLLRFNSWCRHADLMVRLVSVRQPSIRLLRYWMCRRPLRTVRMRCSGVEKATLESQPRRSRDQMPSTGLRSGA